MSTINDQRKLVKAVQTQFQKAALTAGVKQVQDTINVRGKVRGPIWISHDTFPRPKEDDLLDAVWQVVQRLNPPGAVLPPRSTVSLAHVPVEWIGPRRGKVSPKDPQPDLPGQKIYENILADVETDHVILYCHGGAFYGGSPTYSRPCSTKLARLTKSRVVSVQYRLAPQNPFPAAILDILSVFLALLHPAPDARHKPVKSIVFAGDSAGGNLALSAVQALLRMPASREISYNGVRIQIPNPAGVAVLSPFGDLTFTLPSWYENADIDLLRELAPALRTNQVPDEIWPTTPPRADPYCDASTWLHPLVSPAMALDWRGSPPLWISLGQERPADSGKMIASQAAHSDVSVLFTEYRGLPHIFPMFLPMIPQSHRCFNDWAKTCLQFCNGKFEKGQKGILVDLPGDKEQQLDLFHLAPLPYDEYVRRAKASASTWKPYTGQMSKL